MPLKLERCVSDDMEQAFTVVSEAFAHDHPFHDYVFPDHDTEPGRKIGGERFKSIMGADPNTTYLKVVDTDTGTIAGVAKWNVYDGFVPEEVELTGDFWGSDFDRELARDIFKGYLIPRRKAIRESGGHLVSLDVMSVRPKYQRMGAGRMLLRWGVEIADKMGVETVVEASVPGRSLYETEGFEVKDEWYTVKLPEKYSGKESQSYVWMVRPVKGVVEKR